jgi:hypothetical protein
MARVRKTPAQYVADHETPEAAVEAALSDARGENSGARRFTRAYTPLVESLKLTTALSDDDADIEAARDLAREAIRTLGSEKPNPALDATRALLGQIGERLGMDLTPVLNLKLDGLTAEQITAAQTTALDTVVQPVQARLDRVDELEASTTRTKISAALKVPEDALSEWLGDRKPTLGKVKTEDGTESEVYGLGTGESFKPLSGFTTLAALVKADGLTPVTPVASAFAGVGNRPSAKQVEPNPIQAALKSSTPDTAKSVSVWDTPSSTQGA